MSTDKKIGIAELRKMIRRYTGGETRSRVTLRKWLMKGIRLKATGELVTLKSEVCPTTATRSFLHSDAVAFCEKVFGEKKAVVTNGAESGVGVAVSSA